MANTKRLMIPGEDRMQAWIQIRRFRLIFFTLLLIAGIQKNLPAQSKPNSDPDATKVKVDDWKIRIPEVQMRNWIPLFTGVDEARGTIDGTYHSVFYAIRVDLQAPGISIVGTPHSGDKATISETVSEFAQEHGVQVAINGGFFSPCCAKTPEDKALRGLMMTGGKMVSPVSTANGDSYATLLVTRDNRASIRQVAPDTDLSGIYTAVSGRPQLLIHGELNTAFADPMDGTAKARPDSLTERTHPRTAVGVSKDGRFLYLAVIDGRVREYSMGTTGSETAYMMLALGAYNALNLDGGGSSTLVEQDSTGKPVVINRPSDKRERFDGNALGIHALPLQHEP